MHLHIGLGIGLLGLVAAASGPQPEQPAPRADEVAWAGAISVNADTEVELLEGAQRHYNERWNVLVGIDGEWEEVAGAAGVTLRPLSDDCVLGIYSQVRDSVHYLPVPAEGSVTFARGWIAVDQVGAWRSSGAGFAQQGKLPADCDTSYTDAEIAHYVTDGDCWQTQETMEGCSLVMQCTGSGEEGCQLVVQLAGGMRNPESTFESVCGGNLYFSICTDDAGLDSFCIDQP